MVTKGLPPLFGAPWEREEEAEHISRADTLEGFLYRTTRNQQIAFLQQWNPAMNPKMADDLVTAMSIMRDKDLPWVARTIFDMAMRYK